MEKQVDKEHYNFLKYCGLDRWSSYFYQINEIIKLAPKNILEIGVGDGVLGNYIKNNTNIDYKSLDIADDLHPDITGSIDNIPVKNAEFDIVCAFEVLEHLPFESFDKCISEMGRASNRYVILSLPHFGPPIKFSVKIPFFKEVKVSFKIFFPKKHVFNGEHYWEIGKKGYPTSRILQVLKKNYKVLRHFVPFENQYHHFFILEKK